MSAPTKVLSSPTDTVIEIVKWKVRKGSKVDPGSVLMLYKVQGDSEVKKLKSQQVGSVVDVYKNQGDAVQPNQQLLKLAGCSHNIVIKDLCAECGKDLRDESNQDETHEKLQIPSKSSAPAKKKPAANKKANVSMVHSVPELMVTDKHAQEIGKEDELRLRKSKKLVLLVDLDQTLIHTTTDNVPNKLRAVKHFQMGGIWYHTKFRPGTEDFLKTISKYYELHIVTFGVRLYAHTIARMMDSEGKFFSHRILSRDEFLDPNTKKANLKSLFPCGDDMVAIIDDREDVWNYSPNLIPVLPYKFFKATGDINDPSKLKAAAPNQMSSDSKTDESSENNSTESSNQQSDGDKTSNIADTTPSDTKDNESVDSAKNSSKRSLDESDSCINNDGPESQPQEKKHKSGCGESTDSTEVTNCDSKERQTDVTSSSNSKLTAEKSIHQSDDNSSTEEKANSSNSDPTTQTGDSSAEDSTSKPGETSTESGVNSEQTETNNITNNSEITEAETADTTVTEDGKANDEEDSTDKENQPTEDRTETVEEEAESKEEVEVEWTDDDTYLQNLTNILVDLHHEFYRRDKSDKSDPSIGKLPLDNALKDPEPQKVASVIKSHRKQVLEGCVLAFSGLFPQSISLYHSTAYHIAIALGAKIQINVENNVTHLVASRLGTKKVRQAATKENCTIVHPDWLWVSWYNFERQNEIKHLLTSQNEIPEPKKGAPPVLQMCGSYDPSFGRKRKVIDTSEIDNEEIRRVKLTDIESDYQLGCDDDTIIVEDGESLDDAVKRTEEEANRRFSDSFNPLMMFDNDDITAMDAEIDDAFDGDSSSEGEDEDTTRDKELRKKVLSSSDEGNSDSEESLSNDYPKGWGPSHRRKSSPPHHDPEAYHEGLEEEDIVRLQEAAENSPMEILTSSSEGDSDDDEIAAALDRAFN